MKSSPATRQVPIGTRWSADAAFDEPLDLDRFLSALESARHASRSRASSCRTAPSQAPVHRARASSRLLGGDVPDGLDGGAFWESRVLAEDRARYEDGHGAPAARRVLPDGVPRRRRSTGARALDPRVHARATRSRTAASRVDGVVIDVTDQRDARRRRSRTRSASRASRLDSVLASLDEYLYAWRYPADGPAVIDFESIPQATFLGQPPGGGSPEDEWLSAVHPDDRAAALEDVLEQPGVAAISGSGEYRIVDGEAACAGCSTAGPAGASADGDVVAEGIVSDVTVLRQAQDGLAAALAAARVAQRRARGGAARRRARVEHRPADRPREPPQLPALARGGRRDGAGASRSA